jgi:hypothetical protein
MKWRPVSSYPQSEEFREDALFYVTLTRTARPFHLVRHPRRSLRFHFASQPLNDERWEAFSAFAQAAA